MSALLDLQNRDGFAAAGVADFSTGTMRIFASALIPGAWFRQYA
jgi:hypothetical protein